MGRRHAAKAGSWYQARPDALAAEIENCLAWASRDFPEVSEEAVPATPAVMVPHAGLAFSGHVAAAAYQLIRERGQAVDTFVVFGASHRDHLPVPAIWATGSWETPLGDIPVDEELAAALIAGGVGVDFEKPHLGDNAIELQTPLLKYLFAHAKIVPVAVSPQEDSWRRGERAAAIAAEGGRRTIAVASTDLSHYGAAFGVKPAGVGEPALRWIHENDGRFLRRVQAMDLHAIVPTAERDGSACGSGAVAAAAGWARQRGCVAGHILAWTNSYEVMPQGVAEHMVGYASLAFS